MTTKSSRVFFKAAIDQEVWDDLLEDFCPLDSESMPASGADPAEQALAGMWLALLALLASAMWYRGPCQPERQKTHERVVIPQCSSYKRCPKFFYVAAKRIGFWGRSVGS
jgi:hypothetical protein